MTELTDSPCEVTESQGSAQTWPRNQTTASKGLARAAHNAIFLENASAPSHFFTALTGVSTTFFDIAYG